MLLFSVNQTINGFTFIVKYDGNDDIDKSYTSVAQQVSTATTSVAFGMYMVRIQTEISARANSPRLFSPPQESRRILAASPLFFSAVFF
jgi:hypothetical protein